jgi:hypothetical protein
MPVLKDWDLTIDADRVLWGQGADPAVVRTRRPALIGIAEQAIAEGLSLLAPAVFYRRLPVKGLLHERLTLADGGALTGPLISRELGGACEVIVALCTVGSALETKATDVFDADPVRSLALYGVGSAAAETLAEAACRHFETLAATDGLRTGVPLNPGMIGWPVLEGQSQIMALLAGENPDVTLTASGFLVPIKSLSFVLGLGADLSHDGCPCDYCSMRETCRHRGQHG